MLILTIEDILFLCLAHSEFSAILTQATQVIASGKLDLCKGYCFVAHIICTNEFIKKSCSGFTQLPQCETKMSIWCNLKNRA